MMKLLGFHTEFLGNVEDSGNLRCRQGSHVRQKLSFHLYIVGSTHCSVLGVWFMAYKISGRLNISTPISSYSHGQKYRKRLQYTARESTHTQFLDFVS